MRTAAVAIAIIATLAMPASAEECATVGFDWTHGPDSPQQVGTGLETIRLDTVGTYLWVQTGELSSVEIPFGAVSATACAEGVTFALAEAAPAVEPVAEILDLMPDEWARFIEPLTFGVH